MQYVLHIGFKMDLKIFYFCTNKIIRLAVNDYLLAKIKIVFLLLFALFAHCIRQKKRLQ